jgi:hypothetical protein
MAIRITVPMMVYINRAALESDLRSRGIRFESRPIWRHDGIFNKSEELWA